MHVGQIDYILKRENELNNKKRALKKLDMAESVYYGYNGGKTKAGVRFYKSWQNKMIKIIHPDRKVNTIWDKLSGSTRIN